MHAISSNPEIHSGWIKEFWTNAETVKDGDTITTMVAGKKLTVTETKVRRALNIKYAHDLLKAVYKNLT